MSHHRALSYVPSLVSVLSITCLTITASAQEPELPTTGNRVRTLATSLPGSVGGVAVDRSGAVYVADFRDSVWRILPWGEAEVFATGFYGASGNAIDARGNLIQSSFYGGYVSRVDRNGEHEVIAEGLAGPVGVVVDGDDNLYVCACQGNEITKVDAEGTVTSFAKSDLFRCPNGITRTPDGHLFVVNFSDGKMLKVTPDGEVNEHATIPGGGNGHVVFVRGTLYATSFQGHRLYRVSMDGQVTHFAGTGTMSEVDGAALEASFSWPNGIAARGSGDRLFVNDWLNRRPPTMEMPPKPMFSVRQIMLEALSDVVRAAFQKDGVDGMVAAYRTWKADPANASLFTEIDVNGLGYQWLQGGQVEAATRLLELNAESYPQSWNAWDSLAEAFMNGGDTAKAIELYEKSLAINPGNNNAVAMLKKLRGE